MATSCICTFDVIISKHTHSIYHLFGGARAEGYHLPYLPGDCATLRATKYLGRYQVSEAAPKNAVCFFPYFSSSPPLLLSLLLHPPSSSDYSSARLEPRTCKTFVEGRGRPVCYNDRLQYLQIIWCPSCVSEPRNSQRHVEMATVYYAPRRPHRHLDSRWPLHPALRWLQM